MSSDASSSSSIRSFRSKVRSKLHPATFVLPRTGQRLKGLVNLQGHNEANNGSTVGERQPLLPREGPDEHKGLCTRIAGKIASLYHQLLGFMTSELGIGILKCSLAYLLGSLATFIPVIASFLGHQDGKHVVATITVYFHPARTRGSMFKASICAFLAFLYAAFISVTSMCITMFFQDQLNLLLLGHVLVLIVFVGGGFGFMGWTKQRLGDPLVNVACSLASLASVTVLTKEGAVQNGEISFAKISQVLKMVIMGVSASMAVSFLVFPISARKKLRANIVNVTGTLAIMLAIITDSFLSGTEEELRSERFIEASKRHKKAYSQLDKLVKEAKLEHFFAGTEREYRLEKNLVRWVQDITHNMGGLRSAAALQFQLLKQTEHPQPAQMPDQRIQPPRFASAATFWSFHETPMLLTPIDEIPEEETLATSKDPLPGEATKDGDAGLAQSYHPADIFEVFISHLGPSMRSFAFTMKEIFQEIPFGPSPDYKVSVNSKFQNSLETALLLYCESRNEALASLYRQKEVMKVQSSEAEADLEEVSASCGHFSFSLLEIGEQLKDLLAILDELQLEVDERPRGRSWSWLMFWKSRDVGVSDKSVVNFDHLSTTFAIGSHKYSMADSDPSHLENQRTLPSAEEPEDFRGKKRIGYRIWKALEFFRRDDTKFAIKVGAGAAIYALPSFLSEFRPFYARWRGEWGLVSYMLVCSMTIGASNTTGYARFLGTCLGAVCAIAAWYMAAGNAAVLAFCGFLMAIWTFHLNLAKGQGPMGRFIMLTYNLSVLYAYSLSQKEANGDEDEGGENPVITEIVLHRVVAVLSGCIWGVIITRVIWPISAREKLKNGLSLVWLRMSLTWKRDPLSLMAQEGTTKLLMTPREKLELERFLSHLESLHGAASSEFELKGPFPDTTYSSIIRRTRSMVDAFHAMNLELMNNLTASEGELSMLRYTAKERLHLSARISHLLTVLASSMKLEYPLSDVLPSIDHARDRLLARIFHYRRDLTVCQSTTDEDYALLYAYILVTGQLSNEIMEIIQEIGRLFGLLNEDAIQLL